MLKIIFKIFVFSTFAFFFFKVGEMDRIIGNNDLFHFLITVLNSLAFVAVVLLTPFGKLMFGNISIKEEYLWALAPFVFISIGATSSSGLPVVMGFLLPLIVASFLWLYGEMEAFWHKKLNIKLLCD